MATMSVDVEQQERKGGKSTPQYEIVKTNMEKLIRTIRATKDAGKTLRIKFISAGWFDPNATSDAFSLIQKALNKIENDPAQYGTFYDMLKDIPELDLPLRGMSDRTRLLCI